MATPIVELPPDIVKSLEKAERDIHDKLPFLDDVEACGIQCQAQRQLLEELRAMIANIREKFAKKKGR